MMTGKRLAMITTLVIVAMAVTAGAEATPSHAHVLTVTQEYTISDLLDIQANGAVYLLEENGIPVMWNVYLSQTEDGDALTGIAYHPEQIFSITSYGSNGEILQEHPVLREEFSRKILYSMFMMSGEMEINACTIEYLLPAGTETIEIYTNANR